MNKKVLVVALMLICSPAVFAQGAGVAPLLQVAHASKKGVARGSFQVKNDSLKPVVSMLSVSGFTLSEDGQISLQPLAPGDSVQISSTSVRVPPKSSASVNFEAHCPQSCEFFVMTSLVNETKTAEGMSVRTIIPETLYIEARAMRKQDLGASWKDSRTLLIQNNGDGFDRPDVDYVTPEGKPQPFPSLPLLPGSKRLLHFPVAPTKVIIRGEKFRLDVAGE